MAEGSVASGSKCRLAIGVFLLVGSAYLLSGHGRIDSVDGQLRFEATAALLDTDRLQIRDPAMGYAGLPGLDGRIYTPYGPAPSVVAAPLVALAKLGSHSKELRRFLFSFTGGLFGAATAAVLALFLLELGVDVRGAARWALSAAFTTLLWPGAETVLEQGQHAFWALVAVWLAYLASRRDAVVLAALGGLAAGTLVLYQLPYLLHLPLLGIPALGGSMASDARSTARGRYLVFLAAAGIGPAALLAYRLAVFGSPFLPGPVSNYYHPALLGNPLVGLTGLLLSPGKSIFLYSPPLVLALLGFRWLRRAAPPLARTVLVVSAVHLLFIASLSIWAGEWCWGPRYLLMLVPLWCLALPGVSRTSVRRSLVATVLVLGLAVNLLGLMVVHERYYYERGLSTYFWYQQPAFYWRNSALPARVGEVVSIVSEGVPSGVKEFSPSPYRGLLTYFIVPAGGFETVPPAWLDEYAVFHLPRPWPLWMLWLRSRGVALFISPVLACAALLAVGTAGAWLLSFETRRSRW